MRITFWRVAGHRRWETHASAYVDGELTGGGLRRFERHLAGCARCPRAISAYRALHVSQAALPELEPSRSFRLHAAMVEGGRGVPPMTRRPAWPLRAAQGVAALTVVAFISVLAVDLSRERDEGPTFEAARNTSSPPPDPRSTTTSPALRLAEAVGFPHDSPILASAGIDLSSSGE